MVRTARRQPKGRENGAKEQPAAQYQFNKRFKVEPRVAHITFENTDYPDLEIYVRLDLTMDQFFYYSQISGLGDETQNSILHDLVQKFGDEKIAAWNLDDENGNPVAPSGDYLIKTLPINISMEVITHWLNEVSDVPAPLESASPDGKPSAEFMTGLAELSESPQS